MSEIEKKFEIDTVSQLFLHGIVVNGTSQILKFQVVKKGNSLLSEDCKKLKLVTINVNDIRKDPKDSVIGQTKEDICKKYADCFEGLGPISEPYHIKINKDAEPVIHSPRKVPATLRESQKRARRHGIPRSDKDSKFFFRNY